MIWGLRRDLNPPQAVSAQNFEKLSTAAYTNQAILRRPAKKMETTTVYNRSIVVRGPLWTDAYAADGL